MPPPEHLRVRARVRLLGPEHSGRSLPLVGGQSYRPNHNFFGPENRTMAMGIIELPLGSSFCPGETRDLEIVFFPWPELVPEIKPGREWLIQEGPKVVAVGTILEVIE